MSAPRTFNGPYSGPALDQLHFPIGGLGAGMFCLEGTGALARFSLRHRPEMFLEPTIFSAFSFRAGDGPRVARVLEGPVPDWKLFFPWDRAWLSSGMGCGWRSFGLPRFPSARFEARFPFGTVTLEDSALPLKVSLTGWSPFIPGDADASGLPVGAVEYCFRNAGAEPIEGIYSFHARNFLAAGDKEPGQSVQPLRGGFHLRQEGLPNRAELEGSFAAWIDDSAAKANLAWFRGAWFDTPTMLWKDIEAGVLAENDPVTTGDPIPGASVGIPVRLAPGEEKTIRLLLAWFVPYSKLRSGEGPDAQPADPLTNCYRPWYASRFRDIGDVADHWTADVASLRQATQNFTDAFYDTTLPPEVIEAVSANLTILKSTTVLRQFDGRMWAWEGSQDEAGSCPGTCTHVWNYAQAIPHLFPGLERGLRETEFNESQDERGHQNFRAALPIGRVPHDFHAASDGQLGGILKVHRDWRISGDTSWLRRLWPKVRESLDYCIRTWDADHLGLLAEPHHNTYDIEFWGPDGMCGSFYLAALAAAIRMGRALGEETAVYERLLAVGRERTEKELFNGEYFIQKIQTEGLRSPSPLELARENRSQNYNYSAEARALLEAEGPKYQYGEGCLSDGVLGEWMAWTSGLEPVLDRAKVESHLLAVYRHNLRRDFSTFANPQRVSYAYGHETGLLLCTWPRGGRLSLPFPYSEEVWTGIEYQVASHLISLGHIEPGLEIVRAARSRYDGTRRNPFDEIECGHWYARALASYALLQAFSGARYDAVDRVLHLAPRIKGDFRAFLATATGFGTVGVRDGQPFLEVRAGRIDVQRIDFRSA